MKNKLLNLTKNDIPFPQAQISIHNPTINEIGFIGEDSFHPGIRFLTFSKDQLANKDKVGLENKTDFDIFMSIMTSRERIKYKNDAIMVLTLLFPQCQINFDAEKGLCLKHDDIISIINNNNFEDFKDIIKTSFRLDDLKDEKEYNPADKRAAKIAEKLKEGKRKVAKTKGVSDKEESPYIYGRYAEILAVGEHKDINELLNYTVFQLTKEFHRFQMKESYDIYIQAKMAGAKGMDEIQSWMDDIP